MLELTLCSFPSVLLERSALGKVRNPPHTSVSAFPGSVCCACVIAECQFADEMMTCTFFFFLPSLVLCNLCVLQQLWLWMEICPEGCFVFFPFWAAWIGWAHLFPCCAFECLECRWSCELHSLWMLASTEEHFLCCCHFCPF